MPPANSELCCARVEMKVLFAQSAEWWMDGAATSPETSSKAMR